MSAPAFCPHCGYDLAKLEAVEDGPFRYDPQRGFSVRGERLAVAPQAHEVLAAIMLARGGIVTLTTIAERLGYEGDRPLNLVTVHITNSRRAIIATGENFPVETVWGAGVRWQLNAKPSKSVRLLHRLAPAEAA